MLCAHWRASKQNEGSSATESPRERNWTRKRHGGRGIRKAALQSQTRPETVAARVQGPAPVALGARRVVASGRAKGRRGSRGGKLRAGRQTARREAQQKAYAEL